MKKLKKASRK